MRAIPQKAGHNYRRVALFALSRAAVVQHFAKLGFIKRLRMSHLQFPNDLIFCLQIL